MMGGDKDSMSKAIVGLAKNGSLVIVDPHYYGSEEIKSSQQVLD